MPRRGIRGAEGSGCAMRSLRRRTCWRGWGWSPRTGTCPPGPGRSMLITPAADLACVTGVQRDRGAARPPLPGTLPAGVPAEAWAHLALYRARPDAAAIARAQPASAFAAAATVTSLVPLHGQAAWLGESVPVHDSAALLRSPEQAERAARSLPAGEALLLRGQRRPHPGRHAGPRGGPDVAAGRRLRGLPGRARAGAARWHGVRHAVLGHPAVRRTRSPHGAPSATNCSPGSGSTCGAASTGLGVLRAKYRARASTDDHRRPPAHGLRHETCEKNVSTTATRRRSGAGASQSLDGGDERHRQRRPQVVGHHHRLEHRTERQGHRDPPQQLLQVVGAPHRPAGRAARQRRARRAARSRRPPAMARIRAGPAATGRRLMCGASRAVDPRRGVVDGRGVGLAGDRVDGGRPVRRGRGGQQQRGRGGRPGEKPGQAPRLDRRRRRSGNASSTSGWTATAAPASQAARLVVRFGQRQDGVQQQPDRHGVFRDGPTASVTFHSAVAPAAASKKRLGRFTPRRSAIASAANSATAEMAT